MSGTHFPGGISNVAYGDPLYDFGMLDPTKWHVFWEDFDEYVAANYTITRVGVTPTEALADGDGGLLLLTNAATDDSSTFSQAKGEAFRWASDKKMFFKSRFKVSDATQSDLVMGLQITDTTPLDVSDGLFFIKDDGATSLRFRAEKDNTGTELAAHTVVADTFLTAAFAYDPNDRFFKVYIDNVYKGSVAIANAPNDEDLTISFGVQNGEAVAKTMTIDYILAIKQR